jgi:osmotically-inducible protein OsmY
MSKSLMADVAEPDSSGDGVAIERETLSRLRHHGYLALRDVSCNARDSVVCLRGRLPSQYLKQVAQSIAENVHGVRTVRNFIEVPPTVRSNSLGKARRYLSFAVDDSE